MHEVSDAGRPEKRARSHRRPLNEWHGMALQSREGAEGTGFYQHRVDTDSGSVEKVRSVSLAQHALQIYEPRFSSFFLFR